MPNPNDREPRSPLPNVSNLFRSVAVAYLAVAVYLYAHVLAMGDRSLFMLCVLALYFALVIFPLTASGFVAYNVWRMTKGVANPALTGFFVLLGTIVAILPMIVFAVGAPNLNRLIWLILYIGPLGPLLSLLAASVAISRTAEARPRLRPLVLLVGFVPSLAMWTSVLASASSSPDSDLKDALSRVLGLRELSPYFIVYLSAGAAALLAHLGLKGLIRTELSVSSNRGPSSGEP